MCELPDHVSRLSAPLQVWDYISYLQDENERLRQAVEQIEAFRFDPQSKIAREALALNSETTPDG